MRKQRKGDSRLSLVVSLMLLTSSNVQVFVGGRVLFLMP